MANLKGDLIDPIRRALDDAPVHLRGVKLAILRLKAKQRGNQDGVDDVDKFDDKPDLPSNPKTYEVTPETSHPKDGASNRAKGKYGEEVCDEYFEKLGYTRVSADKDVNANGIDAIYRTPDGTYVVVEVKYSSSGNPSLGNTKKYGPQMGDKWITGKGTETDRIFDAVKVRELAEEIRDAFKRGKVDRLLVVVSPG